SQQYVHRLPDDEARIAREQRAGVLSYELTPSSQLPPTILDHAVTLVVFHERFLQVDELVTLRDAQMEVEILEQDESLVEDDTVQACPPHQHRLHREHVALPVTRLWIDEPAAHDRGRAMVQNAPV